MEWLKSVTQAWKSRITEAEQSKELLFGKTAGQLWRFLTRSYRDLYIVGGSSDDVDTDAIFPIGAGPLYKPRLNKCQEYVDLYLPHLLSELPGRSVLSNRPQLPDPIYSMLMPGPDGQPVPFGAIDSQNRLQSDMAATLLGWWLNYTTQEYDLLKELRLATIEALVKGRGVLWHELLPTGSGLLPVSLYDSVDNLFIDPDATTLRDAGYILRKRRMPAWLASRQLGIDETKLLGLAKKQAQTGVTSLEISRDQQPREVEMVEYTEVWSRIGIGHVMISGNDTLKPLNDALESLGAFVWLAIAEGADEPLNLHEDLLINSPDKLRATMEWPLQTYGEVADPWPCTLLDFRPNTDNAWSKSPLEPGLPLQVFIDHLYAYVMSRTVRAAKVVVIVPDDADPRLITALESGRDLVVTRISTKELSEVMLDKLYAIITIPELKMEVWTLLDRLEYAFREAVGLDQFLYGSKPETEPRSAQTVTTRNASASIRAKQMARDVERWTERIARKEGIITRLHVGPEVTSRLFGEQFDPKRGMIGPLSGMWSQLLNTQDPYEAARDYTYSVVSGSGRQRDQSTEMQATMMIAQTVLPGLLQILAKMGDVGGIQNIYNSFMDRISKGTGADLTSFRIQEPVPPAPQGPQGNAEPQQSPGPAQ